MREQRDDLQAALGLAKLGLITLRLSITKQSAVSEALLFSATVLDSIDALRETPEPKKELDT